jgi:hypothetical protein
MAVPIAPSRFQQRAVRGDEFVPIGAVGSSSSWAQCPYRQGLRFAHVRKRISVRLMNG